MGNVDAGTFNSDHRRDLSRCGINDRQASALEGILPALRLITLPHKSMADAMSRIDEGHYVHVPHYVSPPAKGGKAPGGANPDAIEIIYRELFHVANSPAEGEVRGLSPFPRFESDLVRRHHRRRSQVAVRETRLSVRSDAASAFYKIAVICYAAAGISTHPERAIRAWIARERLRDNAIELEPSDTAEIERENLAVNVARQILNLKKGLPENFSPTADMFMRLRKQWVLDNPNMPKKDRRAMAAGIPGLEHIADTAPKARAKKTAKKVVRKKPKTWRD